MAIGFAIARIVLIALIGFVIGLPVGQMIAPCEERQERQEMRR